MTALKSTRDQSTFRSFAERYWHDSLLGLAKEKGSQYTEGSNVFENFEQSAFAWGISIPQDILQDAQKHWTFLIRWAKTTRRPDLLHKAQESIRDVIVYLLLLLFYIGEEK